MALIIKTNINLSEIPKEKIYEGKKGKYLPVTITLNNEFDKFGNNGSVVVEQSIEERTAKAPKVYLGNCKVLWTDSICPQVAPKQNQQEMQNPLTAPFPQAQQAPVAADNDLPF